MKSILKFCQRYMEVTILIASQYKYHVTSKYHHAPKQAWQTRVLIQCRYGLSGVRLFNLMVILFIFLIILNIWIYYTIVFADLRFASIDYGKTNESGGKVRL